MPINFYVGSPLNEVCVEVRDVEDIKEAVDALHSLAIDNLDCPEKDAVIAILDDCLTRLENF